jgi:hypothetical protein
VKAATYSAWIAQSVSIARDASYAVLLKCIDEFTIRAAISRTIDQSRWEHDELRRAGLGAIEFFRDGRALWRDPQTYEESLQEARRKRVMARFTSTNELDPAFMERVDAELRERWRARGYLVPSLADDMKTLFAELEATTRDSIAGELEGLVCELLAVPEPGMR